MAVASRLGPTISGRSNRQNSQRPAPPLSRREWQVLAELSKGATNQEIAWGLGVSVHTVKSYVKAVLLKLKARNRTAAAVRFQDIRNHGGSSSLSAVDSLSEVPDSVPDTLR